MIDHVLPPFDFFERRCDWWCQYGGSVGPNGAKPGEARLWMCFDIGLATFLNQFCRLGEVVADGPSLDRFEQERVAHAQVHDVHGHDFGHLGK